MRAINTSGTFLPASTLGVCILLLAGCKPPAPPSSESVDYASGLNRYYQGRPMCLWPDSVRFPVSGVSHDEIDERGFDALTDAGLLVRTAASRGAPAGSATFDLSPEGRSALNPDVLNPGAGNFCYGRRKVVSVDSARKHSPTTEVVDFRYAIEQPTAWAREDTIQTAFPQVVSELASPHQAEVTLLNTTDGWEVYGTPTAIPPGIPEPHTSTLAKTKTLLHLGGNVPNEAARSSF
jgi:hypothetical protein